jgi:hypothetical protein
VETDALSSRIWTPEQQVSAPPSPQGQIEYGSAGNKLVVKIAYPMSMTSILLDLPVAQNFVALFKAEIDKVIANEKAAQETAQGNGLELPGG